MISPQFSSPAARQGTNQPLATEQRSGGEPDDTYIGVSIHRSLIGWLGSPPLRQSSSGENGLTRLRASPCMPRRSCPATGLRGPTVNGELLYGGIHAASREPDLGGQGHRIYRWVRAAVGRRAVQHPLRGRCRVVLGQMAERAAHTDTAARNDEYQRGASARGAHSIL